MNLDVQRVVLCTYDMDRAILVMMDHLWAGVVESAYVVMRHF